MARRPLVLTVLAIAVAAHPPCNFARAAEPTAEASGFTPADRSHWAFRPTARPKAPAVRAVAAVRTPIDAFILRKLEEKSLTLSPDAPRPALIRRATFDLLGLPPTPEEVEAFAADRAPDAYDRLVDRLLASPHYGEAWGRTWLDMVRYAETAGYKADPVRPLAWKYRDFVIRAFNEDVPYDRFVQEQIAGDELFPESLDAQIATGYLRMWPDESNASVVALARQDALNDLTGNLGSVFLGLSIGCAQCHDHKFDPIKQHDFYRLQAFFSDIVPVDRVGIGSATALDDYRRRLDTWQAATRAVRDDLFHVLAAARAKAAAERRKRFPPDVLAAIDTPPDERTALQWQLFFWSDRQIEVTDKEVRAQLSAADRKRLPALRRKVAELEAARPRPPLAADVMAAAEVSGPIPAAFLLAGGSYDKPLREVRPGFLSVLYRDAEPAARIQPPRLGVSGRRTALARWLTDRDNPLVARVMVNRIWQGHLGRGLVDNANDFGRQTAPPTHPELLDWLAGRLIDGGWNIKAMHRLIMTSAVYRQAPFLHGGGKPAPVAARVDAENRLYWHYGRRRLSAEQVRDAVLAVSGRLDEQMTGPGIRPLLPKGFGKLESWKVTASPAARDRRSVYIFAKRNLPFPLLKAFDLPDMHESCARRETTIIAPQALALFNSEFVVSCGDALARRVLNGEPQGDWSARLARAYRLVFGRVPRPGELVDAVNFLKAQSERVLSDRGRSSGESPEETDERALETAFADLCHVLLNSNELLFLE